MGVKLWKKVDSVHRDVLKRKTGCKLRIYGEVSGFLRYGHARRTVWACGWKGLGIPFSQDAHSVFPYEADAARGKA